MWEAKIIYIISKAGQKRDHSSCTNLKDFFNHLQDDDIHDAVYAQNNFAPSIIIDAKSVKLVSPGCDMDNDMMDFGLAW